MNFYSFDGVVSCDTNIRKLMYKYVLEIENWQLMTKNLHLDKKK